MEDGERRERCFSLLWDKKMTLTLLPKLPGRGILSQGSRNQSRVSPRPVCLGCWPASPGCRNQYINVAETMVQIKQRYLFPSKFKGCFLTDLPQPFTSLIHG